MDGQDTIAKHVCKCLTHDIHMHITDIRLYNLPFAYRYLFMYVDSASYIAN